MANLQALKSQLLADGTIDDNEVAVIRKELYADGRIDLNEVQFLLSLRNEAKSVCAAFEVLFFEALKKHVLADGNITANESYMILKALYADGKIDAHEKKFLQELKAEAKETCPEFEELYKQAMA